MKRLSWPRWMPRIQIYSSAICSDDYEAKGRAVMIRWGSLAIELFMGRIDRSFDDFDQSEDHHEI